MLPQAISIVLNDYVFVYLPIYLSIYLSSYLYNSIPENMFGLGRVPMVMGQHGLSADVLFGFALRP